MVQQEKVRSAAAVVPTTAVPNEERSRANPWLIGGLIGMTLAFLALAGWTTYQRIHRAEASRLATSAVAAWDSARPAAFADVYDANAVLVDPAGNRIVGVDAIAASVRDRGQDFSVSPVGDMSVTPDGTFATTSYRYAGDGRGVGIAVMEIADGTIVRQWNFEPSSTPVAHTSAKT
jgi:hypothetical protein